MTGYYEYKGKKFKVKKSPKDDKDFRAVFKSGDKVDFGAKDYPEYPNTDRGDNYCARSFGMGKSNKNLGDIKSANTLSRKYLWNCEEKKSLKSREKAGLKKLKKEEYFDNL